MLRTSWTEERTNESILRTQHHRTTKQDKLKIHAKMIWPQSAQRGLFARETDRPRKNNTRKITCTLH